MNGGDTDAQPLDFALPQTKCGGETTQGVVFLQLGSTVSHQGLSSDLKNGAPSDAVPSKRLDLGQNAGARLVRVHTEVRHQSRIERVKIFIGQIGRPPLFQQAYPNTDFFGLRVLAIRMGDHQINANKNAKQLMGIVGTLFGTSHLDFLLLRCRNMDRVTQRRQGRFGEAFGQGRVDVDGAGDVVQPGAHLDRQRELA